MEIKIKTWGMFDSNGKLMWILDNSDLDVSDDELCECISEQIYGAGNHGEAKK